MNIVTNDDGTIDWEFSCEVTEVDDALSSTFPLGQAGVYRATIDPTDLDPDPETAFYRTTSSTFQIGDYVLTDALPAQILVDRNFLRVRSNEITGPPAAGRRPTIVAPVTLRAVLDGDSFDPRVPASIDLDDFFFAAGALQFSDPLQAIDFERTVRFDFSSVDVSIIGETTPVAEPPTFALLCTGAFVLIGTALRRRSM